MQEITPVKIMMKNSLKGIFFLGLFLGLGLPVLISSFSAQETPFAVSIVPPAASIDLTDLDVRDQYNRKVESPMAVQQMKNLFVTGFNTLLTFNLTPMAQFVRDLMAQSWNVFAGSLTQVFHRTVEKISAWIQGKKNFSRAALSANLSLRRPGSISRLNFSPVDFNSQISSILSSIQILR